MQPYEVRYYNHTPTLLGVFPQGPIPAVGTSITFLDPDNSNTETTKAVASIVWNIENVGQKASGLAATTGPIMGALTVIKVTLAS